MIYLFYGGDAVSLDAKTRDFLNEARSKYPLAPLLKLFSDSDLWEEACDAIVGETLFDDPAIVYLRKVSEGAQGATFLTQNADEMARSAALCVVLEQKLPKKLEQKYFSISKKTVRCDAAREEEPKRDNRIFNVANAYGQKDKRRLWTEMQLAYLRGSTSKDVWFVLEWQVRNLLLYKKLEAEKELSKAPQHGLKGFPLQNAGRAANRFDNAELARALVELCWLNHQSLSGECELDIALEEFALSL